MAVVFQRRGDVLEARNCLEKAIFMNAGFIEARFRLAALLAKAGQVEEAMAGYRRCIHLEPRLSAAYNNMGLILKTQGDGNGAMVCFRKAIQVDPDASQAYTNLGALYKDKGQLDRSLQLNLKAVSVGPEDAVAHYNLGLVWMELGRNQEAAACFKKAVEIRPDFSSALNSLAISYKKCGRTAEALLYFKKAFRKNPGNFDSTYNLGKILQDVCDWRKLDDMLQAIHQQTLQSLREDRAIVEEPFFNLARTQDLNLNLQVAQSKSIAIERRFGPVGRFGFHGRCNPTDRPLTVGYLSNSFKNHPTAHLMVDLFRLHNREKFNVNVYSYGVNDHSSYRTRIEGGCDRFVDITDLTQGQAASRIHDDRVDILVDLKGHTANSRLGICAMRPAPIQARYLGMAGTTGASFFDYIVTDRIVTPPGHAPYYIEKLVHLPDTYQVNSPKPVAAEPAFSNREMMGLPENGRIFAAFLAGYKIEQQLFDRWAAILKRVPGSVLWLWERDPCFRENIIREAEEKCLDPKRIVFAKELPKPAHLARLGLADLCLDTRVVNGAATTSDALWAGVPVLTIRGGHFASRMSASILTAVGLPELITDSLEQYEDLAVELATVPGKLAQLRSKLARNRHTEPLFDTPRFVRNLENAFEQMWEIYRAGQSPRHITVRDCAPAGGATIS